MTISEAAESVGYRPATSMPGRVASDEIVATPANIAAAAGNVGGSNPAAPSFGEAGQLHAPASTDSLGASGSGTIAS